MIKVKRARFDLITLTGESMILTMGPLDFGWERVKVGLLR